MKPRKIAIIGGGAAGLMAAATLIESNGDFEVDVFERNPKLGAKVIISGGGRCNLTTGIEDRKDLLSKYTRGSGFVKSAIGKFPPAKVMEWFELHGVKLKTEKDLRVFPVSNKGEDVVGVFEKIFRKGNLNLRLRESVKNVEPVNDDLIRVTSDKGDYEFDSVILTTGGNAYRHTGSTGDGYEFAKNFGHKITKLGPSLNSFMCEEVWPKELLGISLESACLSSVTGDDERISVVGPMLFTHFGVSGPATFALSSHLAFTKISVHHPVEIFIKPIAKKGRKQWNDLMIAVFEKNGSQQLSTFLKTYFPLRFVQALLGLAKIPLDRKNSEVSKLERLELVRLLSDGLCVTTVQRRPGDEFVTAGGIELSEVNKKIMQSKLHSGLYFAGEILNVDGVTGGFNLQASWAMGRMAGLGVSKK